MTYQNFNIVGIILLSLCGVMLIVSILLLIKFRIISVIGDLSGRTAKKQIEQIREGNLVTGNKKFMPSPINLGRGKLTEPITGKMGKAKKTGEFGSTGNTYSPNMKNSGAVPAAAELNTKNIPTDVLSTEEIIANQTDELIPSTGNGDLTTALMNTANEQNTDLLENGTDLLNDGTEVQDDEIDTNYGTEVLISGTEVLNYDTEVLSSGTEVLINSTENLSNGTEVLGITNELSNDENERFHVIKHVVLIHTNEVI